jgi:hypothetical protein
MGKTPEDLEKDKILTILKHSGEIRYAELILRGGEHLASPLLELVQEGKVKRRQTGDQGTLYSLALATTQDVITYLVNNKPAIKGTELVTEIITTLFENGLNDDTSDPVNILNQMVKDKEIVEVEYVLPNMEYRVKSLYFPKGTTVPLQFDEKGPT